MAQTMNENTRCAEKGDSETKTPLQDIISEKDKTSAEELKNKANDFFKGLYVGKVGFIEILDRAVNVYRFIYKLHDELIKSDCL